MKLTSIGLRKSEVSSATAGRIRRPEKLENRPNRSVVLGQQMVHLNLHERPKLIAEVSESHKGYSQLILAGEALRKAASELLKLKRLAELPQYTPSQANQIDVIKKNVMSWNNKQLFGRHVLDSTFAPVQVDAPLIEFTVPGLDMDRERYRDEVVSLYINHRLVALAFERTEDREVLLEQFKMMFAFAKLQLRLNQNHELVIGMTDNDWRKWDGQVFVSGQGGRYAEGAPIAVAVNTLQPVVENITQLMVNESGALAQIERVLERVNKMYLALSKVLKFKKERANQLIAFCSHPELRDIGSFKQQVAESPQKSLRSIHDSFQGPSRDNVIKLLRKN
jgi:hypothetical protein